MHILYEICYDFLQSIFFGEEASNGNIKLNRDVPNETPVGDTFDQRLKLKKENNFADDSQSDSHRHRSHA